MKLLVVESHIVPMTEIEEKLGEGYRNKDIVFANKSSLIKCS